MFCCPVLRSQYYLEYSVNLSTNTRIESYQSHQYQVLRQLRCFQNVVRLNGAPQGGSGPIAPIQKRNKAATTPLMELEMADLRVLRGVHLHWPLYFNDKNKLERYLFLWKSVEKFRTDIIYLWWILWIEIWMRFWNARLRRVSWVNRQRYSLLLLQKHFPLNIWNIVPQLYAFVEKIPDKFKFFGEEDGCASEVIRSGIAFFFQG